jgi:hypothetical protein
MKKRLVRVGAGLVLALGLSGSASADEATQCSLRTLRGRYVFSASGFTVDLVSGVVRPKAIVEAIDFNGDGTLASPGATRSVNGVITRSLPSVGGSYTVTGDCAGTITFDGPTFDVFVSPRGNQLWLIQTNPGNVFAGSATRTSREVHDQAR